MEELAAIPPEVHAMVLIAIAIALAFLCLTPPKL